MENFNLFQDADFTADDSMHRIDDDTFHGILPGLKNSYTKMSDVYDRVKADMSLKRDEMVEESALRLDDDLQSNGMPFTSNGLSTLNGFTDIPNAMLNYLYQHKYWADYAGYCNLELDKRAEKPRNSKRFLLRFRNIGGVDHIRAVMSSRYGIIDHMDVMKCIFRSLPGGREDALLSQHAYDGDNLSGNVFLPDYIKEDENSEYSVGFNFSNSEIKQGTFSIKPYLYSLVDGSGYIWGKKDLRIDVSMRHVGKIEFSHVQVLTKNGIDSVLSEGQTLIRFFDYAKDIQIENGLRIIASLCRDYKLTVKQGKMWHKKYMESQYANTAYGIVNALSNAAMEYDDEQRECMETIAMSCLVSKIASERIDVQKRWTSIQSKSYLLDAKTVKQYEFSPV